MYPDAENAPLLIAFFFFPLLSLSLSFLSPSQVAQWPEKEEEEQPMFGEEHDW